MSFVEIIYSPKAVEDVSRLPQHVQKRIATKMRFYASQTNPLRFAKRLSYGELGSFRFRVGDYRVIFDIEKDTIFVLKIAKRDDIYR